MLVKVDSKQVNNLVLNRKYIIFISIKMAKMAKNGQKLAKMAKKWSKNGQKCPKMAKNGQKGQKLPICQKWLIMPKNG